MATNESEISFEQPRSTFGTWFGIVLLFAIFGVFVWVVMGVMPRGDNYEEKRSQARLEKLKTAREEYSKASQGYGWVDKEKGVARIPVQRAMEVSLAELAQRKPTPANPIDPAAANQPGQQTTAPMTPAPGAVATPPPETTPKATAVTGKDSTNRGQPAAAANAPNAAPGTQPGPNASPAASPPAGASESRPGTADPGPTPNQETAGTPIPVPGRDPRPLTTPAQPATTPAPPQQP